MVKRVFFAVILATVFSAVGVSAFQLKTNPQRAVCGGPCTPTFGCQSPCKCFISSPRLPPSGFCR